MRDLYADFLDHDCIALMRKKEHNQLFDSLSETALAAGAEATARLSTSELLVEDRLAALCAGPKPCPSYGLAPGCPPHALSPADFRRSLLGYDQMLVFKIAVRADILLGPGRLPIARQIHRIAALLERKALSLGCARAWALASGSCKELFCDKRTACVVLSRGLPCPHDDEARASLSALGINFTDLAAKLRWPLVWPSQLVGDEKAHDTMGMLAGLLLLDTTKTPA